MNEKEKESALIEAIRSIIGKETTLDRQPNDSYAGTIYLERDEFLDAELIKKIFEADSPQEKYDQIIFEILCERDYYENDNLINLIKRNVPEEIAASYEDNELYDEIREFVDANVSWYLEDHAFEGQVLCVNIMLDAGDANYDFSLNSATYPACYGKKGAEIHDEAGILWLAWSQGYTYNQLFNALNYDEFGGSVFLETLRDELGNTTTSMVPVTFFLKASLGYLLYIHDYVKKGKSIHITKDTSCGLFDPWNGAGSILEIELEKNIEIPAKYIDSIKPDGCRGQYSVADTYGMLEMFWKGSLITEPEPEPETEAA